MIGRLLHRGRALVGRGDEALLSLREQLTPGQRWTSALALGLVVVMLVYGAPRHVVVLPGTADESAAAAVSGSRSRRSTPPTRAAAPVIGVGSSASSPAPGATGAAATAPAPAVELAAVPSPPKVVALVRSGDNPVPGRDDKSIAAFFLARASFTPAAELTVDPANAGLCQQATAAGSIVVAGAGLDAPLRDCLTGAGATIVAFDQRGDRPPATSGGGQVLSTRRGVADALVDTARWGAHDALAGRVGLVVDGAVAGNVDAVVPALRAAGVDVVATAVVSQDATSTAIVGGVRSFAAKAVRAAVFVATVNEQDRWLAVASALAPSLHYVVADGFDSVADETYPPSFDGSLAHTSLRVPWYARSHPETPRQSTCRQEWEASVTPATTLSTGELLDVFVWCEEVDLVNALLDGVTVAPGASAAALARSLRVAAPATSDLGPLANNGWGPTQDAVLVWRSSCRCWQERQSFADRRGT